MRTERGDDVRDQREAGGFHGMDGGDVIGGDPELGPMIGVPGEDDLAAADPAQLGQSLVEMAQ